MGIKQKESQLWGTGVYPFWVINAGYMIQNCHVNMLRVHVCCDSNGQWHITIPWICLYELWGWILNVLYQVIIVNLEAIVSNIFSLYISHTVIDICIILCMNRHVITALLCWCLFSECDTGCGHARASSPSESVHCKTVSVCTACKMCQGQRKRALWVIFKENRPFS